MININSSILLVLVIDFKVVLKRITKLLDDNRIRVCQFHQRPVCSQNERVLIKHQNVSRDITKCFSKSKRVTLVLHKELSLDLYCL